MWSNFFAWSNDKLPHIADVEQFIIAPQDTIAPNDKQLCHVVQNCLFLIHMTSKIVMLSKIAPHEIFCSTDNVRGVRDKFHVCTEAALSVPFLYNVQATQRLITTSCVVIMLKSDTVTTQN